MTKPLRVFNKTHLWVFVSLTSLAIAVSISVFPKGKGTGSKMNLRVAFPNSAPASTYEPTRILLAPEYIFLETIYSPLIEFSTRGEIISGVAKDFAWSGNQLRLVIRPDLYASDGLRITANDVAFSLKRVIFLSGNTHGNLVDLLCDGRPLKSMHEVCPGIVVQDNTVLLQPKEFSPFLVPMLAAIDFAIVPERATDPKTLEIKDYSITSGPYFVESDDGKGHIRLKANRSHYHVSDKTADTIDLIPMTTADPLESIHLYEQNKVDVLTTIDRASMEEVIALSKRDSTVNFHSTLMIRIFLARFTDVGVERLSLEQRAYIGNLLQDSLRPFFLEKAGYEFAEQLFPQMSEGGLQKALAQKANKTVREAHKVSIPENLLIATVRVGDPEGMALQIHKVLPNAKVYDAKKHPQASLHSSGAPKPDIIIAGPDMAFLEDISLLSYAISTRTLGISGEEGRNWLKNYMGTNDKEKRLEKLRDLHYRALAEVHTVPIVSAPYVAAARKPWAPQLSLFFANNPLWQIQKN